jgi:hypothetical protein
VSLAQIEQFYALALNDGRLQDKLVTGGGQLEQILGNAVREAQALGYFFTLDEAVAWTKAHQTLDANGELSDNQLEAVAGGKSGTPKPVDRSVVKPLAQAATRDALAQAFGRMP